MVCLEPCQRLVKHSSPDICRMAYVQLQNAGVCMHQINPAAAAAARDIWAGN